jgi:hypothetical protein
MPFSIAIGRDIGASTRDIVFVAPRTLKKIVDAIKQLEDVS